MIIVIKEKDNDEKLAYDYFVKIEEAIISSTDNKTKTNYICFYEANDTFPSMIKPKSAIESIVIE